MWFLISCFFRRDPPKDPFEEDTNKAIEAIEASQNEEEDCIRSRREGEEEDIEIQRAKEASLRPANRTKGKRKQQNREFKKDGKSLEDNGKIIHSKANVTSPCICNGCNSGIDQDGIYVNAFGNVWHPECLCCLHCHKPIAMHEISNSKVMFHRPCYKEHRRPKCYVCKEKFPSTEQGRKYNFHPFWEEKYCPSHDRDETAKCCSCERLEAYGTKYVMLDDDRWLCRECMECAIMDTYECHHLHLEIRDFFESLHMRIEKEFPLLLVEKEALNRAEEEERIDHEYGIVTRGICLSEEQIVTSVSEGPRMGPNNQLIGMARESQRVVRKCEVTAILILYGLPKFLTGYILAHEMMHAYLRLKGYRNLNTVLEEGICQVLGHMWLETQRYAPIDPTAASSSSLASSSHTPPPAATTSKKGDQSDFEKRLVEFCKYQIETDDSPIYGLGFKKVSKMMVSNNNSLKDTLKEIQRRS